MPDDEDIMSGVKLAPRFQGLSREELERAIYDISPAETPFLDNLKPSRWQRFKRFAWRHKVLRLALKMCGVRYQWQNTELHEWQKDS